MEIIQSKENKLIKETKKLKLKKYRDLEDKFLAEGRKFLDYDSISPEIIFIHENVSENKKILEKIDKFDSKKIILSEKVFLELSSQENSQGVILLYNKKNLSNKKLSDNIVILDNISDPGNLGTIIRICDATNFKDIILIKGTVDAYNEKVIRSTMGSILNVNLIYMEQEELILFLQKESYNIIATYLDKSAVPYNKIKLENKNAIIFGNEGNGINEELIKISNIKTIIPILSNTESLNVGVATGIVLYKIRELDGSI